MDPLVIAETRRSPCRIAWASGPRLPIDSGRATAIGLIVTVALAGCARVELGAGMALNAHLATGMTEMSGETGKTGKTGKTGASETTDTATLPRATRSDQTTDDTTDDVCPLAGHEPTSREAIRARAIETGRVTTAAPAEHAGAEAEVWSAFNAHFTTGRTDTVTLPEATPDDWATSYTVDDVCPLAEHGLTFLDDPTPLITGTPNTEGAFQCVLSWYSNPDGPPIDHRTIDITIDPVEPIEPIEQEPQDSTPGRPDALRVKARDMDRHRRPMVAHLQTIAHLPHPWNDDAQLPPARHAPPSPITDHVADCREATPRPSSRNMRSGVPFATTRKDGTETPEHAP